MHKSIGIFELKPNLNPDVNDSKNKIFLSILCKFTYLDKLENQFQPHF